MKILTPTLVVTLTILMIGPSFARDHMPSSEKIDCAGMDSNVQSIERAPNCQRAFGIMIQCSNAGGGDVGPGDAVREKCEAVFLPKLNAAGRKAYQRELKRCVDKYANMQGSLYQSRTAFCQTDLAVRRAARYEKQR
ncbi:hypothetical protein FV226_22965 [Methylobacterium sp. WL12]|nr:hypothetical protein FV226_22965 [Methylobacterium sp. WL12]